MVHNSLVVSWWAWWVSDNRSIRHVLPHKSGVQCSLIPHVYYAPSHHQCTMIPPTKVVLWSLTPQVYYAPSHLRCTMLPHTTCVYYAPIKPHVYYAPSHHQSTMIPPTTVVLWSLTPRDSCTMLFHTTDVLYAPILWNAHESVYVMQGWSSLTPSLLRHYHAYHNITCLPNDLFWF